MDIPGNEKQKTKRLKDFSNGRLMKMCRLFGVIANKAVDVEFSLLRADKPFKALGADNPDGWGIGWYDDGPRIYKEDISAVQSEQLPGRVKEVRSPVIIAHVRRGTGAPPAKENSHPFSHDNFIFAHNGSVDKQRLCCLLREELKQELKGQTDSEVFFFWLVQKIRDKNDIVAGVRSAVSKVLRYNHTGLNFLLSDGNVLYAFRYSKGNTCYYSLYYLVREPNERGPLSLKSKETRMLLESKSLNNERAVLVCSEKLTEENWLEIPPGNMLIADSNLSTRLEQICQLVDKDRQD